MTKIHRCIWQMSGQIIPVSITVSNIVRSWKMVIVSGSGTKHLFVDGEDFNEIGTAFENACPIHKASLGNGTIRLMKQRDLVDFVCDGLKKTTEKRCKFLLT